MKAVQIIEYNRPFHYGDCPLPDLGSNEARYHLSRINEAAKRSEEGEVVGRIILTR